MTMKTSIIISGDAAGAKKAMEEAAASNRALAETSKRTASVLAVQEKAERDNAEAGRVMAAAQASVATAMRSAVGAAAGAGGALAQYRTEIGTVQGALTRLQSSNAELAAELREVATASEALATGLRKAQQMIAEMAGRVDVLETRLKASGKAMVEGGANAARHANGVRNLGQQFGDLAVMIQGGISPARAFATQAGQIGYAMSEMGGKAGAVGAFLVGPWGIALTVATSVLLPFVEQLFLSEQASRKASIGLDELARKQDDFGSYIDKTTGKLIEQNKTLVRNAVLKRQETIAANTKTITEQGQSAFAAARKARGDDTPIFTAGMVTQRRVDPDLQRVIRSANGDLHV